MPSPEQPWQKTTFRETKPEPEDPNHPLTEEEKNDYLDVSHLRWAGGKRKLEVNIFGEDWNSDDRFLVLRK